MGTLIPRLLRGGVAENIDLGAVISSSNCSNSASFTTCNEPPSTYCSPLSATASSPAYADINALSSLASAPASSVEYTDEEVDGTRSSECDLSLKMDALCDLLHIPRWSVTNPNICCAFNESLLGSRYLTSTSTSEIDSWVDSSSEVV
jgi:hypothetical protein